MKLRSSIKKNEQDDQIVKGVMAIGNKLENI